MSNSPAENPVTILWEIAVFVMAWGARGLFDTWREARRHRQEMKLSAITGQSLYAAWKNAFETITPNGEAPDWDQLPRWDQEAWNRIGANPGRQREVT